MIGLLHRHRNVQIIQNKEQNLISYRYSQLGLVALLFVSSMAFRSTATNTTTILLAPTASPGMRIEASSSSIAGRELNTETAALVHHHESVTIVPSKLKRR